MSKKVHTAELVIAVILAVALAIFIRTNIFQSFSVPGRSMEPTIEAGDKILLFKWAYNLQLFNFSLRIGTPKRGDIVVFSSPVEEGEFYIKRVIAVSGESVHSADGALFVNGCLLEEDYAFCCNKDDVFSNYVKEGKLFLLGDNRPFSEDSRIFGPVPEELVIGRVLMIFSPPQRFKIFGRVSGIKD